MNLVFSFILLEDYIWFLLGANFFLSNPPTILENDFSKYAWQQGGFGVGNKDPHSNPNGHPQVPSLSKNVYTHIKSYKWIYVALKI